MSIKVEFHGVQENGIDSLTGKEGEVYIVTFSDGTATESPLTLKSVAQLLKMKLGQKPTKSAAPPVRPEQRAEQPKPPVPAAAVSASGNGPPVK